MRYGQTNQSLLQRQRRPKLNSTATQADSGRKHRPDYVLLILVSALLVCGAVVVYAIGPGLTNGTELGENYYSSRQLIAILLGLIGFAIASFLPLERWRKLQPFVIGLAALSAVLVRFVGEEVNGVHRWIQFAGFSFQPAELIKLALVLWLAGFLAGKTLSRGQDKKTENDIMRSLAIAVGIIVLVVAGLQSDLGSAAVMMAIVGVSVFVAGLPLKKIGVIAIIILFITTLAVSSSSYRRDRVTTFLNPAADCQAEGYQACQALITIGSGGLSGKGLGQSVQAYGYLPEPANDSIFAIVAEKFGFIGTLMMVSVFWALFRRIARIAQTVTSEYARLLTNSVLVWLSVQTIINIGAMVGLLPLKGITLPFVSYGGTSIIFVMIAIGIVFQASRYTDLSLLNKGNSKVGSPINTATRYSRRNA